MRSTSKLLASVAVAAATVMVSAPAFALAIVPTPTTTFSGPPAHKGSGATGALGGASFADVYTFTIGPAGGVISGTISAAFNSDPSTGATQNIVFSAVTLKDLTTASTVANFSFTTNGTGVSASGGFNPTTIAGGNYELDVDGKNQGTALSAYAGTLDFLSAGVPEPATWAMMITGFGLLGMAVRRRYALGARV